MSLIPQFNEDLSMRRSPTDLSSGLRLLSLAALLLLAGCVGPAGPQGVPGEVGADGPSGEDGADGEGGADGLDGSNGQDGEDGTDQTIPDFVGSNACGACHETQYNKMIRSGHAFAMVPTDGVAPVPTAEFEGAYPSSPPGGYAWSDISYIIGGWGWKARFVDSDGYLVTGGSLVPYEPTQFNIEDGSWVDYEAGTAQGTLGMSCGTCHTTGWSIDGQQDDLPGIVGTWTEPGVTCEKCHGAGGNHIEHPQQVRMNIDRDPQACGQCHSDGPEARIPASDGFGHNGQQWNEIANSKHRVLDCIDCHDPHASAIYADGTWNPEGGIISECASCHFNQAANMDTVGMSTFECTDCHMPRVTRSALSEGLVGDVATHVFAINPDPAAPQFFEEDGEEFMSPYLSIEYACLRCHSSDGPGLIKTDQELHDLAEGFHDPVD